MLHGDGTFDTSYYGRTAPYLYHLESDETLGLFGIGITDVISVGKKIFGPGGGGCVTTGPQEHTRTVIRNAQAKIDAGNTGTRLEMLGSGFKRNLERVASGIDLVAIDCPALIPQAQSILDQIDAGSRKAAPVARPPTFGPVVAGLPGWVIPAAIGGGALLLLTRR